MRKTRFSLYCLDDGDEYFGDAIVDYYSWSSSSTLQAKSGSSGVRGGRGGSIVLAQNHTLSGATKARGRLRIAGRALFFEPDDWNRPIFMFRFKDMTPHSVNENIGLMAEETASRVASGALDLAAVTDRDGTHMIIRCHTIATQLLHGDVGPHAIETCQRDHFFCFPYGSASRFVDKITSLLFVERSSDSGSARKRLIAQFMDHQEKETPFGLSMLKGSDESIVKQATCVRIQPLTHERGRLVVSNHRIYFKPTFPVTYICEDVELQNIRRVERRRCQFREIGLEVATVDDRVQLFAFANPTDREEMFHRLVAQPSLDRLRVNSLEHVTQRWQRGQLSTFDYLMFLNWAAGRSMNDLAQYPVLPWVITDFNSETLDLSNPEVFRDLSKPIGALNAQRLRGFVDRANDLRSIGEEPYLYGSHFSNPAYVAYFLVREHPEYMLVLHGGKLDHGSRLFESIPDTFQSVMTGPTDVKELLPEFYFGDGAFLTCAQRGPDLGQKSDGTRVRRDVQLPPWAKNDPKQFIRLHRMALEGEICSRSIHRWIDLMFGYQQDGSESWRANNVFHPYCYESSLSALDAMQDETKRAAAETHTREFGQMPKKLFFAPHPQRACGATPASRIALDCFAPPDSDELESTQSSMGCLQPTSPCDGGGGATSVADAAAMRSTAAFVSNQQQLQMIGGDRINTDDGGQRHAGDGPNTTQQPSSSVLSFDTSARQDDTAVAVPGAALNAMLRDTEQLVADALDLAHIIEQQQEEQSQLHDERRKPAVGDDSDPGTSTNDPTGQPVATLLYKGAVKCATKGKLETLAICQVPTDADWVFEDYNDDVATVAMVFVGDSAGIVHVLDSIHMKRVRSLADFGPAAITIAVPVSSGGGAASAILLSSLSGSVFVLDLQTCTCQNEYEDVCGSSGMTAMCTNHGMVAGGGKTGIVRCWRLVADCGGTPQGGGTVVMDVTEPVAEIDVSMGRVLSVGLDSTGRRLHILQNSQVDIVNLVDGANVNSGNQGGGGGDAITFPLPQHLSKNLIHTSFARDHMIMVVGRYDIGHYALDGSEWAAFPAPCEVAVAVPGCGGRFSRDALMIASPEGMIMLVVSTSGAVIAKCDISAELCGAVIIAGAVGLELIALADSNGKVHMLEMPSMDDA